MSSQNKILAEIKRVMKEHSPVFATVVHDTEDKDILFTYALNATDYIVTIRPASD